MSENGYPPNVVQALLRVMQELPGIGKDQQASAQQGGYAYRGIEAITREVQPLFAKHGVVLVPAGLERLEPRELTINGKPWTDERVNVLYRAYGPGGPEDFIEVGPIPALGRDNSDKGANKCMTQAYKYALIQALCISDSADDADGQTHEADAAPEVVVETGVLPRIEQMSATLGRLKVDDPDTASLVSKHWAEENLPALKRATTHDEMDRIEALVRAFAPGALPPDKSSDAGNNAPGGSAADGPTSEAETPPAATREADSATPEPGPSDPYEGFRKVDLEDALRLRGQTPTAGTKEELFGQVIASDEAGGFRACDSAECARAAVDYSETADFAGCPDHKSF